LKRAELWKALPAAPLRWVGFWSGRTEILEGIVYDAAPPRWGGFWSSRTEILEGIVYDAAPLRWVGFWSGRTEILEGIVYDAASLRWGGFWSSRTEILEGIIYDAASLRWVGFWSGRKSQKEIGMKKLLLLMLCSISLFSMPAKRTPTAVSQPDGTTFSLVGFGDERYNYAETLDGYVAIQGTDHYWYYAVLSPEGRFIPGNFKIKSSDSFPQNQTIMNIPRHLVESKQVISDKMQAHSVDQNTVENTPNGSVSGLGKTESTVKRVLVLCVQFPDLAATQTSLSFQDMINDDNWKSSIGGMSKYYKEVSYNAVSIQAEYRDWITAAQPSSYYAYSNASYSTHVRELISQCLDSAEAGGVDFSLYDNDGDGAVDGLFIVHAGIGAEEGSQTQYIWSHQSSLGVPYSRAYDGKTENQYIIMPEKYGSNHVDIGVFCHEYGHMLGLPDLYDTDGATNGGSEGVGNWCLMAGGSWGGNGYTPERPSHMSAYCKELLGYTTPNVVTSSQALSIPRAETNSFSCKMWMDSNQSDEYMLIENRQQTGFDANLPASGLLMYHVDKNLVDIWPGSNKINVTNTHLGVKVYEADGLEQLAGNTNRGNAGDPYPGSTGNTSLTSTTTPNSTLWNTSSSGVEINSISASSATMTATAVLPAYYGYNLQFYRKAGGYSYGSSGSSAGYGMVKCTPTHTGKLSGVRVLSYANRYTNITATAFTTFSSNALSSQVGSPVSGASSGIDNYIQLNFSPEIDVTQNVPIYVRIFFQRASGGYAVPIDVSLPATGNSYFSSDGVNFSNFPVYDIFARVVFRSNSALPIQLASFTADAKGLAVTLNWKTATEINNFGFEVEKDTARVQQVFASIPGSFTPGQGTTLVPHTYTFVDGNVAPGKWAYRLKQIDLDGTVHVFESKLVDLTTTEAGNETGAPTIYVLQQNYPNPFNPSTTIRYGLPKRSHVTLTVFNVPGQQVAQLVNGEMESGYHAVKFDASGLSSGVYFYRLRAGDFVETRRFLLIR
jgi:M6 family metalloprotease-like protein